VHSLALHNDSRVAREVDFLTGLSNWERESLGVAEMARIAEVGAHLSLECLPPLSELVCASSPDDQNRDHLLLHNGNTCVAFATLTKLAIAACHAVLAERIVDDEGLSWLIVLLDEFTVWEIAILLLKVLRQAEGGSEGESGSDGESFFFFSGDCDEMAVSSSRGNPAMRRPEPLFLLSELADYLLQSGPVRDALEEATETVSYLLVVAPFFFLFFFFFFSLFFFDSLLFLHPSLLV
jgi:hypothetical protein